MAVFTDSLDDVQASVELIRRRILVAGAIALVLAALGGYVVARALTDRIKRLERAARKVAAGDFSNAIHADSDDELGQLAATFDDMQRQLARLDTARKQFIASASHELRTPIFSLGGFLELLEDEELDEETRAQFLSQLRGQVARMRKLATELLDLSRLESGALELRTEPTDVGQLAREVAGEFTPAVGAHDAELQVHAAPRPDRGRVRSRARGAGDADPARQRARAHARGNHDRGFGRARGRACHPAGCRLGPRHPPSDHAAYLRAFLHLRRRRARRRARPRDRARARRAHERPADRALRSRARRPSSSRCPHEPGRGRPARRARRGARSRRRLRLRRRRRRRRGRRGDAHDHARRGGPRPGQGQRLRPGGDLQGGGGRRRDDRVAVRLRVAHRPGGLQRRRRLRLRAQRRRRDRHERSRRDDRRGAQPARGAHRVRRVRRRQPGRGDRQGL